MNELKHHGIKDQRWGIRRFQNKDGTLTEAGKKRYGKDFNEKGVAISKKAKDAGYSTDKTNSIAREEWTREKGVLDNAKNATDDLERAMDTYFDLKKKKNYSKELDKMSDQEIRDRVNRMYLENNYSKLMNERNVSKGKEYTKKILKAGAATLSVASSIAGLAVAIKTLKGG